ncbi:hypothetical protein N665_0831s0003 [Sinapis alba]|nr:hypothetical protein N665_0831s0003 [Sinapis alba]
MTTARLPRRDTYKSFVQCLFRYSSAALHFERYFSCSLPSLFFLSLETPATMTSLIRRCSQKGKAVATDSESESTGSPLIRRSRAITFGGMDNPRPTSADLASLDYAERDIVRFSLNLEDRETTGHAPANEMEQGNEIRAEEPTDGDLGSAAKEKITAEKEVNFALADFLPMKWTGTDFPTKFPYFPNKPTCWVFVLDSRGSPATMDSAFRIVLGQYTANGIRILVTLTVLAVELGIKMSVRLFEELTTLSITAKTGFFYGKMVPKYNVITGKPSKVNFWNHRYFYVKINEASFKDPTIILNGYFNSNIDRISKWSQGGSESFLEEVEAIRTLSHPHWPDISEARIQAASKRVNRAEIPTVASGFYRCRQTQQTKEDSSSSRAEPSIVTPTRSPLSPPKVPEECHGDDQEEQDPAAGVPVGSVDMTVTKMPMAEHPTNPPPEDVVQGGQLQEPSQVSHGEEVEYPHVIDFKYRSIDVPFIEDHEAPACLFRQIKLKKRGMPELDQLHQDSRYREMTRAGVMFLGNANLMVRDYEAKLKAQEASLTAKTGSLKKKRKEISELSYKCNSYEGQIEALTALKNEALSEAELERSRNKLLSAEMEALKAQKDLLDSRCLNLEQEKSELSLNFEATTRRLRESREHEVRKERMRVESILRQRMKGTREGLEKIQSQGLAMDEVLQKEKIEEAYFLEELQKMEVVDADEIDLHPISLDEYGSNMVAFSPQGLEDLRS